jgi:hypothetical protein
VAHNNEWPPCQPEDSDRIVVLWPPQRSALPLPTSIKWMAFTILSLINPASSFTFLRHILTIHSFESFAYIFHKPCQQSVAAIGQRTTLTRMRTVKLRLLHLSTRIVLSHILDNLRSHILDNLRYLRGRGGPSCPPQFTYPLAPTSLIELRRQAIHTFPASEYAYSLAHFSFFRTYSDV